MTTTKFIYNPTIPPTPSPGVLVTENTSGYTVSYPQISYPPLTNTPDIISPTPSSWVCEEISSTPYFEFAPPTLSEFPKFVLEKGQIYVLRHSGVCGGEEETRGDLFLIITDPLPPEEFADRFPREAWSREWSFPYFGGSFQVGVNLRTQTKQGISLYVRTQTNFLLSNFLDNTPPTWHKLQSDGSLGPSVCQ